MTANIVKMIGDSIGEVEDIELSENMPEWSEFSRVRIRLDITHPLPRFKRLILVESDVLWARLTYEKFPTFFYCCGNLGRVDCDRSLWSTSRAVFQKDGFPYGTWLRADRGINRNRGRLITKNGLVQGDSGVPIVSERSSANQIPAIEKPVAERQVVERYCKNSCFSTIETQCSFFTQFISQFEQGGFSSYCQTHG